MKQQQQQQQQSTISEKQQLLEVVDVTTWVSKTLLSKEVARKVGAVDSGKELFSLDVSSLLIGKKGGKKGNKNSNNNNNTTTEVRRTRVKMETAKKKMRLVQGKALGILPVLMTNTWTVSIKCAALVEGK